MLELVRISAQLRERRDVVLRGSGELGVSEEASSQRKLGAPYKSRSVMLAANLSCSERQDKPL